MNAVRVEADLNNNEHVRMYEDMLDECYEPYSMGGMTFYPSDILKSCDPIAYRCGFNDFFDDETILGFECGNCGANFDSEDEAEDCCKIECEVCGTLWDTEDEAKNCCSDEDEDEDEDEDDE